MSCCGIIVNIGEMQSSLRRADEGATLAAQTCQKILAVYFSHLYCRADSKIRESFGATQTNV
jgi:hypothetical protein